MLAPGWQMLQASEALARAMALHGGADLVFHIAVVDGQATIYLGGKPFTRPPNTLMTTKPVDDLREFNDPFWETAGG